LEFLFLSPDILPDGYFYRRLSSSQNKANASFFIFAKRLVTELPSVFSFVVMFHWQDLPQSTAVGAK
jgi:hypothetical protein